jgi:uncharacterized spore protein YtfJ
MDAKEVLDQARDAMTVKRVFGDPYEKDGLIVIPVANVMGGAGAGGGTGVGVRPASADDEAAEDAAGENAEGAAVGTGESGYGMGYGLRASPAGVYVIKGGDVEWKPALDTNRLALQRAGVMIVGLLVLRSIVRTIAKR